MFTAAIVTQPTAIFFIVLVIILAAPLLLNRLKIPHVIGMIVAGVIIGPYGFDVLDNDSSFAIFGQVGLLYLMFLAGLEIDMYHLRLNLGRGLVFGALTLVIPMTLGVATSVWLLHLDWLTALLLGAMYASHTLISYPMATRFGITRSPAVLIAIVGTIIAVIGSLLVLAATMSVKREGAFNIWAIAKLLGLITIYCLLVLYAYPRLARYFFKHFSDRVTQYVFILALVFLSAQMARFTGLEGVLGAFFAGLVLNRYIPQGSSLMNSIEFVGNALFIPYFLISVGMMINVRVIGQGDTLWVSAVMLAVALLSKWLPAFITQKAYGLSAASRGVIFGLTTAHTAVALAVVTLGYNTGMLSVTVLNSTVLVILATCALAPIITAGNAPKLKIQMMEEDADTEGAILARQRHNHTLISLETPIMAQSLVELAALMRNHRGRHQFYALHVRNDNSPTAREVSQTALGEARKAASAADIKLDTLDRFDLNYVTGVLNAINERDITEVIVGMHRRTNIIDSFFGQKIEQLLRATNRMIMISRCFIPPGAITRIVVWCPPKAQYETGFSRWVRAMARLAKQVGCRVIYCCPAEAQPLIRGVLYQENYGIRCEFRTIEDWDDFIVMSNRVLDDDLFVVIGSRANSVSYDAEYMHQMPAFLQKYFAQNNLMIIFPEQGGDTPDLMSFADPLTTDMATTPPPWLLKLRGQWRRLVDRKRAFTHRNRRPKIDRQDA